MFDQLMKRSNWVCVYKMGRFAEERRAFLCDLNKRGHSLRTLRYVNRLLLTIAEQSSAAIKTFCSGSCDFGHTSPSIESGVIPSGDTIFCSTRAPAIFALF